MMNNMNYSNYEELREFVDKFEDKQELRRVINKSTHSYPFNYLGRPIIEACNQPNINKDVVKLLLENGAELCEDRVSILSCIYNNNKKLIYDIEFLNLLCGYGANINSCNPIYKSCMTFFEEIMFEEPYDETYFKHLIRLGADLNRKCNCHGFNVLMGNLDMNTFNFLIRHGASPFLKNNDKYGVIDFYSDPTMKNYIKDVMNMYILSIHLIRNNKLSKDTISKISEFFM